MSAEPKKILIIDDEAGFTRLVKLILQKTGHYEVLEQNRAEEALETARTFRPDLILLDVIMPEMDGGDVIAHLKADPHLKSVPIIFLTATVRKKEVDEKGGIIGGFPFIAKPVNTGELIEKIEAVLGRREE